MIGDFVGCGCPSFSPVLSNPRMQPTGRGGPALPSGVRLPEAK